MNSINSIFNKMFFSLSVIVLLTSCGGETEQAPNETDSSSRIVSGIAAKGPLVGATIEIFAFDADGNTSGSPITSTTTGANGQWSVSVPSQTDPLLVISSGG